MPAINTSRGEHASLGQLPEIILALVPHSVKVIALASSVVEVKELRQSTEPKNMFFITNKLC
jgi:L-lactate utilization protein LutC